VSQLTQQSRKAAGLLPHRGFRLHINSRGSSRVEGTAGGTTIAFRAVNRDGKGVAPRAVDDTSCRV
jgi:hypothetical protein